MDSTDWVRRAVIYNGTENCMPNKDDVSISNPYSDLLKTWIF